jgi:hypothetical protein
MNRSPLLIFILLFTINYSLAKSVSDSTRASVWVVTPRLNSAGYFPFTGALLNHNTNFDLNMVYQNKTFGFLAFKSFDLQDSRSAINYLQSALFKQVEIGKSVTLGFYAGYLFSQTQAFRDKKDSDCFGAFSIYWNVNQNLRIENIALLNDVSVQRKIVNRLSVLYTLKKFRLDLSAHERFVPETGNTSTSAAFALLLPRVALTNYLAVQSTITYQTYLTRERPDFALQNGFLFSVSFPLNFSL